MNESEEKKSGKKFMVSMVLVIFLSICLVITTYALVMVSVSMPDNYFQTGNIDINLNDGKPVITEHEFIFEPGMTVTKEFFIESRSTWDVFYKIYFDDVQGGLANILKIEIRDDDKILFAGTAGELSENNVKAADDVLRMNEKRNLTISFHYPKEKGNETQDLTLAFKLCAEAVQTKNNPDKAFY